MVTIKQALRTEGIYGGCSLLMLEKFVDPELLPEREAFIASQSQQAWIRFALGIIFTLYIAFHGPYFERIIGILAVSIPAYLLINLYCLYWIRRQPYSSLRLMLIPLIDCYLITLAMWADGGHMSVTYFLLMSPIIGNGFRYGSRMLRYCQFLGLLSMIAISLLTVFHLHLEMDWLGLAAELLGVFYISGYAYNIISRIEATLQAKMQAETSVARLLAENPHPAFTFDSESPGLPILSANPAMASLISVPPESLSGKPVDSLVILEDREAFLNAILDRESNRTRTCYVRLPGVLGQPIQVKCEISSTRHGDRHLGLCYMTDISESERLQYELAEAQKLAYTAALAAGIAHDFRNILSGMIGQAELIELEHDDRQLKADARHIIEAGERGSRMIDQLLELGRREGSDYRVMDISEAITNMLQIARVQLPPDIELKAEVEAGLPHVRANTAQLEQVLLNLIGNAAQAMPNKRGRIDIRLSACHRDGSGVLLSVQDNGCGIEEENLQHIFKPFWSTRKQSGGSGLGLAMVQRIIRWHKGSIEVESTPGKGTRICICLPGADATDMQEAHDGHADRAELSMDSLPQLVPWTVLLVEDQPEVMRIHKAFLVSMGQRVITATDGQEALDCYRNTHDIDMVLSDYMMPSMDGMQMAREIRHADADIPITIITAFGEDQALANIAQENIQLLGKPLSYGQLLSHLKALQMRRKIEPGE